MADLPPGIQFVWGDKEVTEKGVIVFSSDDEGGYRCPLCNLNFETRRKEVFQKHFDPKRGDDTSREAHRVIKEGIPSIKEKCTFCKKPGDPNPGKQKKHHTVCKMVPVLDENDNNTVAAEEVGFESNNDKVENEVDVIEDGVDNHVKEDEVHEDYQDDDVELDEDEYNLITDKPNMSKDELEVSDQDNEDEGISIGDQLQQEILLLKKSLIIAENKHETDENKLNDLSQKFEAFMKVKDEQLEEMEKSVTTLEELRCEQLEGLENKLETAKEAFEHISDVTNFERKHLEEKVSKLEESVKRKDEEVLSMKSVVDLSKKELKKVFEKKAVLEKEICKLKNIGIEEKKEAATKLEKHEEELNAEIDNLKKKNEKLEEKLHKMEATAKAGKKEPMIKSLKLDRSTSDEAEPLGEGGYAKVTKVRVHGKYVALKTAPIEMESITEALTMSKLNHPNVVCAIGVSFKDQQLLISMEVYDIDLSHYLEKAEESKNTDSEWRLKIFKDCSQGLEYLHRNKIIHRDLKPDNILIKQSEGSMSAALADFGCANLGLEGSGWCGTRGFIAPELYTDGTVPKYNERVDLWSLGASMYELLVGDSLVKSEETAEEANPTPMWEEVKIHIPIFLRAVKGLLVMDPKQRMTAREVRKIL